MTSDEESSGAPDDVETVTVARSEVVALITMCQSIEPDEAPASTTMRDRIEDTPQTVFVIGTTPGGQMRVGVQYTDDRYDVTSIGVPHVVWEFLRLRESEVRR